MKYVLVDCCPLPKRLAPVVTLILHESGATLASGYRGTDAEGLLAKCGKHDQAWLYAHLPPGQANPPGRSTHELRSDAVAYRGPVGRPLRWWQCGLDLDDAHVASFIARARTHGWIVTVTYPTSPVEYHHVNFRKPPILYRAMKRGSRGPRVLRLTARLCYLRSPHTGKVYLEGKRRARFGSEVEAAVRAFQKDHHLHADGVVGAHTAAQVQVSFRRQRRHRS